MLCFGIVGCGNSKKSKDERDLDYFVEKFQAEYEVNDIDKPQYQLIKAIDGVMFYVDNHVVKIYQFDSKDDMKIAIDGGMVENGLFTAESSNDDLEEFFTNIK